MKRKRLSARNVARSTGWQWECFYMLKMVSRKGERRTSKQRVSNAGTRTAKSRRDKKLNPPQRRNANAVLGRFTRGEEVRNNSVLEKRTERKTPSQRVETPYEGEDTRHVLKCFS